MEYFPEDLFHLVLVRLPAQSLLRFKFVSKSWYALISSPKFIKMHLDQSLINQNPNMLLYKIVQKDRLSTLHILAIDFSAVQENLAANIHLLHHHLLDIVRPLCQPFIAGSCNGLLCVVLYPDNTNHKGKGDIFLCNPLTKSHWELPKTKVGKNDSLYLYYYGFGYDDAHDDYKVIIGRYPDYKIKVYSLRSGSWTKVGSHKDSSVNHIYGGLSGVLVNCALHWLLMAVGTDKMSILAFDLRTEKHRKLPIPEVLEKYSNELSVLNGCLLVKAYGDGNIHHLWMMKDYGLKDSWTCIFTHISFYTWVTIPVALLKGEKKLVVYDYNGMFLLYDLVEDEVVEKKIIPECEGFDMPWQGCIEFVGSLALPW